jgi:D-psicose/D-tagatose/L-ribulose 3-epimerase
LLCEKGIEEFEIPMRVLMDRFHANMEEKNIDDAVQAAGSRLKRRPKSQNECNLPESGGNADFPAIVAVPSEDGYDSYFLIEGYEHSAAEINFLGASWGDLNVTRNEIVFEGTANLHSAHAMGDAAG